MKTLSFFQFGNIKTQLRQVLLRFPLPSLLVFLVTGLILALIHFGDSLDLDYQTLFYKFIITSVPVFFLSLGGTFFGESYKFSAAKKILSQVIILGFWGFFYSFLGDLKNINNSLFTYVILTTLGMVAFLYVAPFVKVLFEKKENQAAYFAYFYELSVVFLTSFIVGGALVILGVIGIGAIFTLFGFKEYENYKIYEYWVTLSCAFFAPFFWLLHLPVWQPRPQKLGNRFYDFLVKFIGIPFIFFYFFILYAYTGKVLMNFSDWPNGEISWMVIGFSFFGYLLYIGSYLLADKSKFIRVFRQWFPFAVLPQVLMLFYAIYLRIAQYDITMNRYFVVVFGIWLFAISLYFVLSKKKYMGLIALSLALSIAFISVGPWGVYTYPQSRQLSLLLQNLDAAHILKDGKIIPLERYESIDKHLSNDIYEEIRYVCENSDCKEIRLLFADQIADIVKSGVKPEELDASNWLLVDRITGLLKVQQLTQAEQISGKYYQLSVPYAESLLPLSVEWYDILAQLKSSNDKNISHDTYFTVINPDTEEFILYKNDVKVLSHSLQKPFSELRKKREQLGNDIISSENLIFDMPGNTYDVKLLLDHLSILRNPWQSQTGSTYYDYESVSGYALIKEKTPSPAQ